jgi:hypothetical protein
MHKLLWLAALTTALACRVNRISRDGPTPEPTAVSRADFGHPPNPVFCAPQGGTLLITGNGFAPMPRKVLTDEAGAVLPTVRLSNATGTVTLVNVTWNPDNGTLTATIPAGVAAGVYDLVVENPNGRAGTLQGAVEITAECLEIELCGAVDPAFGWVNGRTRLEICANNAYGAGLIPVPEVFLVIDDDTQVPLIREAMLSTSSAAGGFTNASLMSAVVPSSLEERGAGIVVGGPYDLVVVNPNGAQGVIPDAFRVVADPPPVITAISPEQAEKGASVTLTLDGGNFKDPAASLNPRVARILLLGADLAPGAACASPSCFECTAAARVSAARTTCTPPLATMGSGAYLVRYEHLDDGSFSDFAAFAVTNPSGNLASATAVMPDLHQARYTHAAAFGRDDLGNRFVWVAGGKSGNGASSAPDTDTALDTVEVAALSRFGDLADWTPLPGALPERLAGLSLSRFGNYLFAVGGVDEAGVIQAATYRARILGEDTAPVIAAPVIEASGNLAVGSYTYRVSAVMDGAGDNPNGETLASDAESAHLSSRGAVRVRWNAVAGAASYRVFRTPTANALAGTEVLLADAVMGTDYLDDGSATPGTAVPQPPGALGRWVPMPSLLVARADHGATIAIDSAGNPFLYVLGGVTTATAPEPVASIELAPLTDSGGVVSLGAFVANSESMDLGTQPQQLRPRSEQLVATLSAQSAPLIAGLNAEYVVVAQGGTASTVHIDVTLAKVTAGGQLAAFTLADSSASADRYGMAGFLANNFVFSIAGRPASGREETKGRTIEICAARNTTCGTQDPPTVTIAGGDSGITLREGRYRPAGVYVSGYLYVIGGAQDDGNVTLPDVERGGYAQ